MSRLRSQAGLTTLVLCAACRPAASPPASPTPRPPAPPNPFLDQPYASAPLPAEAKVFLVAGGDDIANFAADVLEQRQLWHEAGLRDEELACYYAKPSAAALAADREQFEQLAPALVDCYSADPVTLHAHLRQAAERAPPFIYLFVSSHGLPPLLRWKASVDDPKALREALDLKPGEIGRFDRHTMGLEAGDGPGLGEVDAILGAHRQGAAMETLIFSPATLAAALSELPPTSETLIVLQACFSGGFIGRPPDDGGLSELTDRANTTILTATSPTRPSFGCGAGARHTYYGGAFNQVLADTLSCTGPTLPPALPWADIYDQVHLIVTTMEGIDGERPSQPRFFTNRPGAPLPRRGGLAEDSPPPKDE